MPQKILIGDKEIYKCVICGFGYKNKDLAEKCQNWCSTHKSCNLQITKNAIYFPK
ncbi:MAG: hypothetical protein QXO57_00980 [Candidatus Aenigmatarchaeota archaeon]|nr:hypothetical protein [Candidatus Aenigmarchaeota archaeon]